MQPVLKREVGEVGRRWEGSSPTLARPPTLPLGFPLPGRQPCLWAGPLQPRRPAGLRSGAESEDFCTSHFLGHVLESQQGSSLPR